jgi:uncharacterized membrane protein
VKKTALALFAFLILASALAGAQGIESLEVFVDPTGYVKVVEIAVLDNYSVVNVIPLLTKDVDALTVLDENGSPVFYNLNGSSLEVIGNSTMVNITYYTASLTSKSGEVWTVSFKSDVPAKVVLPQGAVIVDLSDIPLKITNEYLVMPPGNVSVSYILPPPTKTKTSTSTSASTSTPRNTASSSESSSSPAPSPSSQSAGLSTGFKILMALLVLVALLGVLWYLKGRGGGSSATQSDARQKMSREELERMLDSMNLNDEEKSALLYIYDRGGKAKQSDVRAELGIPKTTAWRMFQRLEKQGLVRVYKKGRENWVELKV